MSEAVSARPTESLSGGFLSDQSGSRETIYVPERKLALGAAVWAEMLHEAWGCRELTYRLFYRDLSARFRQSVLGYFWAVAPIIFTVFTFVWLNRARVLPVSDTTIPYPLFLLFSLTIWQLFAGGLTGITQSLVNAGSLIGKINFPREALVFAAYGQPVFEFLIRCLLLAVAFMWYRTCPSAGILLLPLVLLPLALFTLGLGFLLALANAILRDVGQVITVSLTLWMFLTPVIYPSSHASGMHLMQKLNPVAPFIVAAQDLVIRGSLTEPGQLLLSSVVSIVVFLAGWRIFHFAEPLIAERV